MICSWFWLFNTFRMFFIFASLFLHVLNIIIIFLIKNLGVLFCKFSFFLKLKYWSTKWSFYIKSWKIIFTNINFWA
jgi:hypothetical protein